VVASHTACYYQYFFNTLARYVPEGFEKIKWKKKLTNRYDTESMQSNAGKQSWSRTPLIIIIFIIIIMVMLL